MFMIEIILSEVGKTKPIPSDLYDDLYRLLQRSITQCPVDVSSTRWVLIATHLLGFLQRRRVGETVPTIEEELVKQISTEMKQLSQEVLYPDKKKLLPQMEAEVFLLAVHFETAQQLDVKEE